MSTLTTVIPVYNGENFLAETLDCVYKQTRLPDRVVVLDNCSTDRTSAIVEGFRRHGCEWLQNERNVGLMGNLNRALKFASETDHLHLLMADDLVVPLFYERLLVALKNAPDGSLAYCFNDVINETGKSTATSVPGDSGQRTRVVSRHEYLVRHASLNTVLLPAVIFKTSRKPPVCFFQEMPQVADCLFLAEWGKLSPEIVEVPECLCHYRVHPANATSRNVFQLRSWVLDEWIVVSTVLAWIKEPKLIHWVRTQKLKCLFAARSHVKANMVQTARPDYATEIRKAISKTVGPGYAWLGSIAVFIRDSRDRLLGRRNKTAEQCSLVGLAANELK